MSMEGEKSTVEWRELVAQKDEVIKAQGNEIVRLGFEIERLEEENKILIHKRFARSAEQILADEKQGLLFSEEELKPQGEQDAGEAPEKTEIQEIKSYKRRKAGRKPINSAIPRVEKIIDIAEDEKTCGCGAKLTKIGEETSEKLIIKPPVIEVEKTIRPKYACRHCEGTEDEGKPTVKIAPPPPCIIPRSIASSSLLAHVITQKFEYHLPYYRQERQFAAIDVDVSRQDMANWQRQAYEKILPLFALLKETIKSGEVIRMDETTVQVMGEEGREDTQKSYMWLAMGGPVGKTAFLYEYHKTRGSINAKEFLEGFKGYVQTDGYKGYDTALEGNNDIIHVGCFAHARRKFIEATTASKKNESSAHEAIKHIKNLYIIEGNLRSQNLSNEQFLEKRKEQAEPVLGKFKAWLDKRALQVPPSLALGKAIHYTLGQWPKLVAYLEHPELTPDNNASENAIRPFVLGRKNWLFCQSVAGAESSCGMYSLIETAKVHSLIPFNYLMKVFDDAPYAESREDWEKLLPWNVK